MVKFYGKKLLIGTRNAKKIKEIKHYFQHLDLELISVADICDTKPEENGQTFLENALIKARAYTAVAHVPTLADDAGLCINTLYGAPGIHTARFANENGGFQEASALLARQLEGHDHRAFFYSCLILMLPDGQYSMFEGITHGTMVFPPRGPVCVNFDNIFKPDGFDQTYAEMTPDQLLDIGYRAQSLRQCIDMCF